VLKWLRKLRPLLGWTKILYGSWQPVRRTGTDTGDRS